MSKKFANRSQLNLSQVNKEVLQQWDDEDVFHLFFMRDRLQLTVCRESIT